ncbi:MAG: YgfZ/GcvT domain-containing protein [Gammaproteobacteria bacterium]
MNENPTTTGYLAAACFDGADAAAFLHGQFSADIAALPPARWRRAAYCSPKGRALATMIVARRDGGFVVLLPASLADSVAAGLSRFVLRAKVKISRPPCAVDARVSAADFVVAADGGGVIEEEDGALEIDEGGGARLRLRFDSAAAADGDDAAWRRMQILRGVPWIDSATSGRFVPQYFNWDLLGGVSFQKGCYVGQEIIARLHYLGNVRRRGYILRGGGPPPAAGEKIGAAEVINAAPDGDGFAAFVVAPRDFGDAPQDEKPAAELAEPPYGLPSAAEEQKPKPKVGA